MAAPKARDLSQKESDFLKDVYSKGLAEARRIHGIAEDQIQGIFDAAGLSPAQVTSLQQLDALSTQTGFDPAKVPPEIRETLNTLGGIINAGGATDETRQQRSVLENIQSGNTNEQISRRELGFRIGEQQGRTGESQDIFGRAKEVYETGGRARADGLLELEKNALAALGQQDKDLSRIREAGLALANAGGFTPELKKLMGQATTLLNTTGGLTPELRQVFDESIKIVRAGGEGGALLPRDQVIQFAREEAAKAINQNAEAAIRESMSRGGGPGAILGGAQGRRLAEFADQASELQASTMRQALTDRQSAQLAQYQTALQAAGGAAEAGAQREVSLKQLGASLAGQLANAASSNLQAGLGTALGAQEAEVNRQAGLRNNIADIGQIFTQREASAFGTAQNALNLDLDRLKFGTGLLTDLTGQQLDASGRLIDLTGLEFGREENALNSQLANLNFGATLQQQQFENAFNVAGANAGVGQAGIGNILTGAEVLNQQGTNETNLANTSLSASAQAARDAAMFQSTPGSFTGSFLSGLGTSLGSGAGKAVFGGFPGQGG